MKITIKRAFISLLLIVTLFITYSFASYAWSTYSDKFGHDVIGESKKAYFADGDGSINDPFIISKAEYLFNLSYLQNAGQFTTPYYFKVADLSGNPVTIDFSLETIELYRSIYPIGDETNSFIGNFDGNYSTFSNLSVEGDGLQDIGLFGYLGTTGTVENLFIDQIYITSNPSITDDKTGFHTHNDELVNRATGYLVGHLTDGATVSNIFFVKPTIDSLTNNDANRSQYGLIGYTELNAGTIANNPRNAYNFDFSADTAYSALTYAQSNYANYYINGSSSIILSNVLSFGTLSSGYSLSTLKISTTPSDPDPVYLIDQLVADGYTIGGSSSEYVKENIDIVGTVDFNSTYYQIYANLSSFTTPIVDSYFDPNNYPNALFLYVKPTNQPTDLGDVTGLYSGGGDLSYLSGFDTSGNYIPSRGYINKNSPGVENFGASNVTQTMSSVNAWASVVEEIDPITEEVSLRVVDETVVPDYYVFLVAVTNGQITISDIYFSYVPQLPTAEDFESIGDIDYISIDDITTIIADPTSHVFSYLYVSYDLTLSQNLKVLIDRSSNGDYSIYLDYSISDSSLFYFDVFNINSNNVNIYVNNTLTGNYSSDLITVQFLNASYNVTVT